MLAPHAVVILTDVSHYTVIDKMPHGVFYQYISGRTPSVHSAGTYFATTAGIAGSSASPRHMCQFRSDGSHHATYIYRVVMRVAMRTSVGILLAHSILRKCTRERQYRICQRVCALSGYVNMVRMNAGDTKVSSEAKSPAASASPGVRHCWPHAFTVAILRKC